VLVATGHYLGEGFDDARLDTVFLTMPISWRGTLSQYAGRLHRRHAAKRDVVIYDYVDENKPMLMKMATKRESEYRSLRYRPVRSAELDLTQPAREPAIAVPCGHLLPAAQAIVSSGPGGSPPLRRISRSKAVKSVRARVERGSGRRRPLPRSL
jgi:superfamily II DNA or RNA helicase